MAGFLLVVILVSLSVGGGIIVYLKLKYIKHSRLSFVSMIPLRSDERRAFKIAIFLVIAGMVLAIVSPTLLGL